MTLTDIKNKLTTLKPELHEVFGCKVDLVPRDSLRKYIGQHITAEV